MLHKKKKNDKIESIIEHTHTHVGVFILTVLCELPGYLYVNNIPQ